MNDTTVQLPTITVTPGDEEGRSSQTTSVKQAVGAAPELLNFGDTNMPEDVATMVVNDLQFNDWESVSITAEHFDAASQFRFTAAERSFPPGALRQFGPGDRVAIYLGNSLVIDGYLELRQIGYDSDRHTVELRGVNRTAPIMRSSVDTKTGSFDNMSFQEVAEKVLSAYPQVGLRIVGALNPLPFKQLQNQPGEQIWTFLERIARPRGIHVGNDGGSNFMAVGLHAFPGHDALIEGNNIKRCSAIYHKTHNYTEIAVIGQSGGNDEHSGTDANEQEGTHSGTGYFPSKLIIAAEQTVWGKGELDDRAKWEALWLSADEMKVFCTVVGWYRRPGKLWWPLDEIYVNSPMVPMDSIMTIKTVTFKQDRNSGTETEIELVFPWGLNSTTPVGKITGPGSPGNPPPGQPPGPVPPGQGIEPIPD